MLNDRVLPWYEEQGIPILRILTDRGTEYKGNIEHHAFELFLSIEGIELDFGQNTLVFYKTYYFVKK